MKKRITLGLVLALLSVSPAFADFKYTEEIKTEMQMPGMLGAMMQNQMQNTSTVKTVYIQGLKKRVDYVRKNVSAITRCDKKQIIMLDNNRKIYNIKSMTQDLDKAYGSCEAAVEASKVVSQVKKPASNKQVTIKNTITDTHLVETIGGIKTRKYIKETSISGNPNCIPNMHTKEYLWAANIPSEEFKCSVYDPYKKCKGLPMPKIPDCFKNLKIVNQGLTSIPGYIIKEQIIMDMSEMMQNMNSQQKMMQGVPTGGGADIFQGITNGLNIFNQVMSPDNQNNNYQENEYPQQYQQYQQYSQYQQSQYQQYQQNNYSQNNNMVPENSQIYGEQGMPKMVSITTTIRTNISRAPLPASLFEIPAGYKLNKGFDISEASMDF